MRQSRVTKSQSAPGVHEEDLAGERVDLFRIAQGCVFDELLVFPGEALEIPGLSHEPLAVAERTRPGDQRAGAIAESEFVEQRYDFCFAVSVREQPGSGRKLAESGPLEAAPDAVVRGREVDDEH
jgi:hypothetical protein